MRRFLWRLRALLLRSKLDRELDDEIAAHLELSAAEHLARGMTAADARLAALRQFGGVARTKEAYREASGFRLPEIILHDVRYGIRSMRRTPAFAAVAMATLALAIGANASIFSVVDAVLIRPLSYRDADRLVLIEATHDFEGMPRPARQSFSLDAARRWQEALHAFESVTYFENAVVQLTTRGGSELVDSANVSSTFFSTLGGPIAAGRPLTSADSVAPSIVISDRLARRVFGSAPAAVGAHLRLNSTDYVVVGVAGGDWNIPSRTTDVWQPAPFARTIDSRCCSVDLLGRLKPGTALAAASADVRDAAQRLAATDARSFGSLHTTVTTVRHKQLGDNRAALLLLWAVVSVVFIVACANLLTLLLARNLGRSGELAIRQALGASRGRLVMQALIESMLLAAGGVIGGLAIARIAAALLRRVDPATFPELNRVHIAPRVLAFAIGLGIAVTLGAGLLPALRSVTQRVPRTISPAPVRRDRRLQRWFCTGQFSGALVLLVTAMLLGRSLVDLMAADLGVLPEHVTTASINLALGQAHTAPEIAATLQRVVDRVQRVPGVQAAGVGTGLPPNTSRLRLTLRRKSDQADYAASAVVCTPGYFHALGIRLLQGRFFAAADDARHEPVLIVGEATARHLFGDESPIGQKMRMPKFPNSLVGGKDATVVGVVSEVKYSGIDTAAGDQVYAPFAQLPWLPPFLVVRTVRDADIAPAVRHAVTSVDPTIAVSAIRPLEGIIATATAPARFRTVLIATFAFLGLTIAAIGLYGVIAYMVSQRTSEIGVRIALGADSRNIMILVMRDALAIVLIGLGVGLPASYETSRAFAALLFGVRPSDPVTYMLAAVTLTAVAVAASYVPARRASRIEPMRALRVE